MRRCLFERLRQDRTQRDVARSAKIHQPVYSHIERGRVNPTSAELQQIAVALGWSGDPDRLLDHVTVQS
jgi:transcriptional regulator with XRE-family HTH domain